MKKRRTVLLVLGVLLFLSTTASLVLGVKQSSNFDMMQNALVGILGVIGYVGTYLYVSTYFNENKKQEDAI